MKRRWVVVLAFALAATACSGSAEPEGAGGGPGSAGAETDAPFRLRDGALRGVMLTDAVAENGSAVARLTFTTDDTRAVALVGLGQDVEDGATLSISWYRLGGIDEREPLFTHEIGVGPGGQAFSEGLAQGGLAPGVYEIVATLGGDEVRLPWHVEVAGGEHARARGSAGLLAQIGDEDWNVPDAGDSGWGEPEPSPGPPSPPGPCEIAGLNPGFDPMRDVDARATWIGTCSSIRLEASMSGTPETLAVLEQIETGAPPSLYGSADVCDLPGGSDLPGAVVTWTATGSEGATLSSDLTLPDFGESLQALIQSDPEPGPPVEPGQRIALRGMAMVMPPALGVQKLTVQANGATIVEVGNASESSSPEPCDDGRLGAVTYTHYDVPQDAPPVIEICARAIGFDGTQAEHCIEFSSGETWTGTITGTGVNSPPGSCEPSALYDYPITIVVSGQGEAVLTGHGITSSSCGSATSENDIVLTGRRTESGFTFPESTFPGPLTITVTGTRGSGGGNGTIDGRFRWEVQVDIEQVGSPGG